MKGQLADSCKNYFYSRFLLVKLIIKYSQQVASNNHKLSFKRLCGFCLSWYHAAPFIQSKCSRKSVKSFFFYLCLKTEIIACWLLPLWISCKESYIHVFVILEILLTVTAEIRSVLDRFLLSVYNKDLSVPDAPVQTAEVSSLFQGPSRKLKILLILFEFWLPSNCFFCVFLLLCPQLTVFQCLFYPAGEALWSLQSAISSLLLLLLHHFK